MIRLLELRGERGESSREDVDLVLGELGVLGEPDGLGREQSLQPEQQRVLLPPLGRGRLVSLVELDDRRVHRAPARGSRHEVDDRLALEQDRLTRELAHALQLILLDHLGRTVGADIE